MCRISHPNELNLLLEMRMVVSLNNYHSLEKQKMLNGLFMLNCICQKRQAKYFCKPDRSNVQVLDDCPIQFPQYHNPSCVARCRT